jgi:hypothetical protein
MHPVSCNHQSSAGVNYANLSQINFETKNNKHTDHQEKNLEHTNKITMDHSPLKRVHPNERFKYPTSRSANQEEETSK